MVLERQLELVALLTNGTGVDALDCCTVPSHMRFACTFGGEFLLADIAREFLLTVTTDHVIVVIPDAWAFVITLRTFKFIQHRAKILEFLAVFTLVVSGEMNP